MSNSAPTRLAKSVLWATLAASLLGSLPAAAQVSIYNFQSVSGTYQPLSAGANTFTINGGFGTADDGYSSPITLPFSFPFSGGTYTSVIVNSNGFLGLGGSANTPNFNIDMFPNATTAYDRTIAFAGIDMENRATVYRWRVDGSAPSRIWKLEASNFDRFNGPGQTGSAQVWLYEGTGQIDIVYGQFSNLWDNTNLSFEVGLRGAGPTDLRTVGGTWAAPTVGGTASTITTNATSIPALGQTFQFTVPAGTDVTPPTIGPITLLPSAPSCTAQAHTVNVAPTDASGIASATISYSVAGAPPVVVTMTNSGGTWSGVIPAQGTNPVRYVVRVTDASPQANVATSAPVTYADAPTAVDAGPDVTIATGQTATLTAAAPMATALKITEVTLNSTNAGATTPRPSYLASGEDDFVEISNTGAAPISLAGYGFEVRSSANPPNRTYTFPAGVTLPARGVLVLHLGPGTDDPTNRYYHTGGVNDALSSSTDAGFILTAPDGQVLDAMAINSYQFLNTVSPTDWLNAPGVGPAVGTAGASLIGADQNNGTNWQVASNTNPQTLGAYNAGVPDAPRPIVAWSGGLLTGQIVSSTLITPVHPTAGMFTYTASYIANGCAVTDDVVVTVVTATTPVADFSASTTTPSTGQVVTFTDLSTNLPGTWQWSITPSTVTFVNGTSATSQNPQVTFDVAGCYAVALTATNGAGSDTETKNNYVCAALAYCETNLQQNACASFSNWINTVSITGTPLNNPNTGCNSANGNSYVVWPNSGATTAALNIGDTYTLSVTTNSSGATGAWIDYNANGQLETSEYIQVQASGPANQPASVQVTVPGNAVLNTDVRLRIRNSGLANGLSAGDACVLRFSGETEDYTIRFVALLGTGADAATGAFSLAPNPTADGRLTAYLPAGTTTLRVLDGLGRVVRTLAVNGPAADLDLRALPAGLYLVQATTPAGVQTRRLVRE